MIKTKHSHFYTNAKRNRFAASGFYADLRTNDEQNLFWGGGGRVFSPHIIRSQNT